MNILFLHAVSGFGGSTKSLLELFKQLKALDVTATVLCPAGQSEKLLSSAGMKTHTVAGLTQFDNTLFSYYRKIRWLVLLREFAYLLPTLLGLLRVKAASKDIDIIHANEITLLPIAVLAKKIIKRPLLVHVRSIQRGEAKDWRSRFLFNLLAKHADAVIAIDKTVQASLPSYIHSTVVHNGLNLTPQMSCERQLNPLLRIGIVGMLLPLKGIYEFLEAAKILIQEQGLTAQFVIVGENARSANSLMTWFYKKLGFSKDVMKDIQQFITDHNLKAHFEVTGFVQDIHSIYAHLDVLCFPSHLNAPGRPVFEAALFKVPSIVALKDPQTDALIHKQTGLCIENPTAIELAHAIAYFLQNPQESIRMGLNAYHFVENIFNIQHNAKKVRAMYQELLIKTTEHSLA